MTSPTPRSRAYRLGKDEDLQRGVRRIARGRADDALARLGDARNGDLAKGVHEARKSLKKERSLLRLVREGLGDDRYREQNARYRSAGRMLSGARDAEVKLQTLARLEERFDSDLPADVVTPLRRALEAERPTETSPSDLASLEQASAEIRHGRDSIARWNLDEGDVLLARGLQRTYRRGRRLLAEVKAEPSDHNVHEWRKRVKDLWYQLRILEERAPETLGPQASLAHDVSELIGDHHDLAVLIEDVEARREILGGAKSRKTLIKRIRQRQDELVEEAVAAGEGLYSKKPRKFMRSIGLRS